MTLTFLFVYCFLLLTITPRFCCNYANFSTGHFIVESTLYQMLESGKDTSLHRPDDRGNVSYKQLVRKGV